MQTPLKDQSMHTTNTFLLHFSFAERFQKEAEEERVRKQKASAEKAFYEGIAKAKQVLRRSPIGTDRSHNR